MHRRRFLKYALAVASSGALFFSCTKKRKIKGEIIGASSAVGHKLRENKFPEAEKIIKKEVVIVGGGVSGLSAARYLKKNGIDNFILLELEPEAGGNSRSGKNEVSSFPWGAHYIPTPNNDLKEYLEFLRDINVITSVNEAGLPVYNEEYICFDPQERLYINGRWQDGLVPHYGLAEKDVKQVEDFLKLMDVYRDEKGTDGKFMFAIPARESSKTATDLDNLTMKAFMLKNGYTSEYLHKYINYCTRDDFGTPHDKISAWMGIHYFASRKGKGANANHNDVLTWPEGNGFLVKKLLQETGGNVVTGKLVTNIQIQQDGVLVTYFDPVKKIVEAIQCTQCIVASPHFITARLLQDNERLEKVKQHLHYVPWMVANIKVSHLTERSGAPLSWDNVIFGSDSLGYVEATHELLSQSSFPKNLTYYLPLTDGTVAEARLAAQQRTHEQWVNMIIDDLKKVHPDIDEAIEEVNIMIWGHAMAQPLPGLIQGSVLDELSASVENKIHFAHTDLAGCSIFEEAFYQGINAGKKVISFFENG